MKRILKTLSFTVLIAADVALLLSIIHMFFFAQKGIVLLLWGAYMLIASRFLWILGDEGEKK